MYFSGCCAIYNTFPSSQLQKLNIEGNQLEGFPPGLMKLPLKQIVAEGNLLHVLLWSGNARNQPQVRKPYQCYSMCICGDVIQQRLSELCHVTIFQYGLQETAR